MLIYLATNTVDGKQYVGQSVQRLAARKASHKCDAKKGVQTKIALAIAEHGFDCFTWQILENDVPECLGGEREQYWVAELSTLHPNGYNVYAGGRSGYSMPDETKAKLSALAKVRPGSRRGAKNTPEMKAKRLATLRANGMSEKFRAAQKSRALGNKSRLGQRWELSSNSTITREIATSIREDYACGNVRQVDLAEKYGLSQTYISRIIRGVAW